VASPDATGQSADQPASASGFRVSLGRIFRDFVMIGVTSYGSGRQIYLLDTFVTRRGWITMAQFTEGMGVASLAPGANFSNLATYVGYLLGGWKGGLVAQIAVIGPGIVVIIAASAFLRNATYPPFVSGMLEGAAAVAVALLLGVIVRSAPAAYARTRWGAFIAVVTFIGLGPMHLGIIPCLLIFVPLSLIINRPRRA
jgi:chromate transporter